MPLDKSGKINIQRTGSANTRFIPHKTNAVLILLMLNYPVL